MAKPEGKEGEFMAKQIARRQREWSEGHERFVRLVQQLSTSCDTCSVTLARTHDYVFYGTLCPSCWSTESVGIDPNGLPLVRHAGEKESVYAECVVTG